MIKKKYIVFTLFMFVLGAACGTGLKIDSLCIMDPGEGMCWVNKGQGKGIKISEMENFYALNEADLKKVVDKLNECKSKPDNP